MKHWITYYWQGKSNKYGRAYTHEHQMEILQTVGAIIVNDENTFRLLVIMLFN